MPKIPPLRPRWGTDPDATLIEPAEDVRQGGFAPGDRPPAEWENYWRHLQGQWFDVLLGPGLANWQRVEIVDTGPVTPGLGIANLDADNVTIEPAAGPRRRLVFTEPSAFWTSKRGDSWKKQSVGNLSDNIGYLVFSAAGTRWVVSSQDSKLWWSWPDDGTHTSSIGNAANDWHASTIPGGLTTIAGLAAGSDGVVCVTSTQVLWSADGTSFALQTLSAAPTGDFIAVLFVPASESTPAGWIAVTNDGEIYRAPTTGTATWTKNGTTTLPTSSNWRLECDDAGHVLAYRIDSGTAVAWYVSNDGGQTWSSQSAPTNLLTIKQIRFIEGLWFACAATPGVGYSNSLDASGWMPVRLPIQDGWSGFNPVMIALSEGRLIAPVSTWAYASPRSIEPSPGPWVPGAQPAELQDAGYFRGRAIDPTAPSVGDVLTWDGSLWTPTAGGGGGAGTSFSVSRTNTTGSTLPQGAPVYNASANINLSRANASATARVLGLVAASTIAGATATLITHGAATIAAAVQTGTWVDGDEIYLDDATAGKLTNVAPTAAGTFALPVGTCVGTPGGGSATLVLRVGGRIAN